MICFIQSPPKKKRKKKKKKKKLRTSCMQPVALSIHARNPKQAAAQLVEPSKAFNSEFHTYSASFFFITCFLRTFFLITCQFEEGWSYTSFIISPKHLVLLNENIFYDKYNTSIYCLHQRLKKVEAYLHQEFLSDTPPYRKKGRFSLLCCYPKYTLGVYEESLGARDGGHRTY